MNNTLTTANLQTARDSNIVISSFVHSPFANSGKTRGKKVKGKPGTDARTLQLINRAMTRTKVVKYFDLMLASTNSTTTVGYEILTPIPQGVTQSERIADTIWVHRIDLRGNWIQGNSDEFSTVRYGFFIWWQNTLSSTPGSASVYENALSFGPFSPLNFEGREYYSMMRDYQVALSGTAASPTINTNRQFIETINLTAHRVDFNIGATSGVGHCYFVNYSDSGATPFPIYNLQSRVWYMDD